MAAPYEGNSMASNVAGIKGTNGADNGIGVSGESATGIGVHGEGGRGIGSDVIGFFQATVGVFGKTRSDNSEAYGVYGESTFGAGVRGFASSGDGVQGASEKFAGVSGQSREGVGVRGEGGPGAGSDAIGFHQATIGVLGKTLSDNSQAYGVYGEGIYGAGVRGYAPRGDGVQGFSQAFAGVSGQSEEGSGVQGRSKNREGVFGASVAGEGVHGESHSPVVAAVAGIQLNPRSTGAGIYGEHMGNGPAGFFKGNVVVTKDILLTNADCAEEFDVAGELAAEPGTVMVLCGDGALHPCGKPYDKSVIGVVSGAGDYKPAIILDKRTESSDNRVPIALMGKVFCKVDAGYGVIEIGDLLTTSPTPGHAMKADDPLKAFGAVIGKALRPLREGTGLVPILITRV